MTTFNDATKDMRAAIYGSDYDQGYSPDKETQPMSTTALNLKLTDVEPGRTRAEIGDGTGYGVFAEASTPQDAAAQAVKAYVAMHAKPPAADPFPVKSTRPVQYGHRVIERILRDAVVDQSRVRIEYEDSYGHETTRTIKPSKIGHNGNVIAYDELRNSVRAFRLSGVQSVQELSG